MTIKAQIPAIPPRDPLILYAAIAVELRPGLHLSDAEVCRQVEGALSDWLARQGDSTVWSQDVRVTSALAAVPYLLDGAGVIG